MSDYIHDIATVKDVQRRLLESVPARLSAEGEPELSEAAVRDDLADRGWDVLGAGLGRVAVCPPEDVAEDSVVVKLSRPRTPDRPKSLRGPMQNEAERRVWDDVCEGVPGVSRDWFAPVYETGSVTVNEVSFSDAWLVMERYRPLTNLDRDEEWMKDAEAAADSRFLDTPMRPDSGYDNVGLPRDCAIPENPSPDDPFRMIDYGMPNFVTEDGLY